MFKLSDDFFNSSNNEERSWVLFITLKKIIIKMRDIKVIKKIYPIPTIMTKKSDLVTYYP